MTPAPYTEDTLVQKTTAEYLEHQLEWRSVYAYNNEDFGPASLLGRKDDREVVLTRPLRKKLIELNPGLPDEAYDDAIRHADSANEVRLAVKMSEGGDAETLSANLKDVELMDL